MVCFQEVIHAEIACGQQLWLQGSVQLPWRSRVNSHQVQCNNIPTFRPYLKKCAPVSGTMQEVQQCMVARSDAVRLFILVFVLILWTLQPHFTLWLSALMLVVVWGHVQATTHSYFTSHSQGWTLFLQAIFVSYSEFSIVSSVTS